MVYHFAEKGGLFENGELSHSALRALMSEFTLATLNGGKIRDTSTVAMKYFTSEHFLFVCVVLGDLNLPQKIRG